MHANETPVPSIRRLCWVWLAGLATLLYCLAGHGQNQSADLLADNMLERIGGRAAWAKLRNTINGSQQNRINEPTVVYAVITIDFERPRFRIETTAPELHLIRVINGADKSWRLRRTGRIEPVPEELFLEDMTWYQAHLYRTIHRIAARDPDLALSTGSDGRLEVFLGEKRLLWFKLDARGEPYAFGVRDDNTGSLTGPWDFIRNGIHHPRWISSTDGTWRAAVKALDFNVPLHERMFVRPGDD